MNNRLACFGICFILACQIYHLMALNRLNEDISDVTEKELQTLLSSQSKLLIETSIIRKEITQVAELLYDQLPFDCSGAQIRGDWRSTTQIKPPGSSPRRVRCDQFTEGGGWTVVVHRTADDVPSFKHKLFGNKKAHENKGNIQEDFISFNRTWSEYKTGFGDPEKEYWIGNDVLHSLTKERPWEAAVVLEDWNGTSGHAFWESFRVLEEEKKYKLEISGFVKAKSNIGDGLIYHSGIAFSTYDVDNDEYDAFNCGKTYGGGWWFRHCHVSYLTGTHLSPGKEGQHALHWLPWRRNKSLKLASMMIRPQKPFSIPKKSRK